MSFAIISLPGDLHAYAMDWALRAIGQRSRMLETPLARRSGWRGPSSKLAGLDDPETRIVFRRSADAEFVEHSSDQTLSILDAANIEASRSRMERDLEMALCLRFEALNRPADTRLAACKISQTEAAAAAGLAVPDTLVTEDAAAAAAFCRRHGGQVVFKPYRHNIWQVGPGQFATSRTQRVETAKLEAARLSLPSIFQEVITKRAEIRVCVFADQMLSVRQRPKTPRSDDAVDWRRHVRQGDDLDRIELPVDVKEAVFRLCKGLRVQLATLDLAEDRNGRLWFLDFNPNGQFLYLEEVRPELSVLRTCIAGLLPATDPLSAGLGGISYKQFLEQGYPAVRESCEAPEAMMPLRFRKTFRLSDLVDG